MTGASSRSQALEDISAWGNADVVDFLRKNGVDESCCKAVQKRQIDGDELLHLTEGKLTLWKNDLTRPLIWSLWTFVEEVRKCPEKFVAEKQAQQRQEEEEAEEELRLRQQPAELELSLSDTSPWDTDFEDSVDDPSEEAAYMAPTNAVKSLVPSDPNEPPKVVRRRPDAAMLAETTYANCEATSVAGDESTYANVGPAEVDSTTEPPRNCSRLHSVAADQHKRKSLAEQLTEQLILMGVKPTPAPKPVDLCKRSREMPRTSFLHKSGLARINVNNNQQKKESIPATDLVSQNDLKPSNGQRSRESAEETLRKLPKPPVSIRSFDLVANLPTTRQTDESDEEESYEVFDEQIVEQHKRNSLVHPGITAKQNSVESIFQPPKSVEQEEDYEIYESITESPEENGHDYKRESNVKRPVNPPPLPAKPPPIIANLNQHNKEERSPDKKSATLPHSGSNASLNNAARPLPPPPNRTSYHDRPWYHNLTREQANQLIEQGTYNGTTNDGYFLMRPSTTNPNNPLTLVLWCRDRVYNVPVRRRPDNRYALGTSKPDEQSFESIDDIIPFYKRENLVLYTGGVQTGSTRLTDTPPK